jgi:hypothetical protein
MEESVRICLPKFAQFQITSGSVFLGETQRLPSERVAIPREIYKMLVRSDDAENLDARAYLLIDGKRLPFATGTLVIMRRRISGAPRTEFCAPVCTASVQLPDSPNWSTSLRYQLRNG